LGFRYSGVPNKPPPIIIQYTKKLIENYVIT